MRDHRIPNRLVLPAAGTCAILEIVDPSRSGEIVVGLAVVGALLIASLTQPSALGMGDVKLALLVVLGLDNRGLRALALGFVLAALTGLAILARHGRTSAARALPLAPFFALGSLLALLG